MLNPNWLATFKTLIETGHFTQTAEKLFMTQPGVSQHVRKLEEACGHTLIKRINKTFEITEQGKMVYDYACQQEQNERNLLIKLGEDDPFSGRYKLACSGAMALTLYPQLLDIQHQHSGLSIEVEAAPNLRIMRQIEDGDADVGIVTYVPNQSMLQVEEIGQEPLFIVVPKGYEQRCHRAETLLELGLVSHPDAEHYLSLYLSRCGDEALRNLDTARIKVKSYVNQINQILIPVAKGLGFTLLPKSAISSFVDQSSIAVWQSETQVYETLYLIHKRHRVLPQRMAYLNQALKTMLSPCLRAVT
ncbi:LysR family transcriptional regulator [Vibrio fluvialis]|uniref:LysR family transcriptional regulator n=1 Tax=Vibrio fluvialis TaxID=676 RepID=UPI0014053171|nr:LysR family transcriptional regulator [Vibrio fluvialis]EKO3977363.1 LysR family transcriptional regulator [Vibrio fluvialis]ELV8554596.1 LysR family transcriptional regulator [Vibrio fluvialis]ELV8596638.1 LysR family transcriptional regulator [Vibrio fluvialis]MBY8243076.1 LysR family transcriptional regulator [Vibrio fluvialis]NHN73306.1 LysR family transcriptional regulator [Vibrio fluvialis]